MRLFTRIATGMAMLIGATVPLHAEPLAWVTLGTNGGPIVNAQRSEPANMLLVAGKPWLVDSGDGAMERLAGAHFEPSDVSVVFISHLHMDHIGGLQALIGLRWMLGTQSPMTIYGPPGIQEVVDGIVQSLKPVVQIGEHEPMKGLAPDQMVKVVILRDKSDITVAGVRVRAVQNTHFGGDDGNPIDNGSESLSYRFDSNGDSITYTGDTGPSTAVANLAEGSNFLISELFDRTAVDAKFEADPNIPEARKRALIKHFDTQHLSPQQAGKIAAAAHVKHLVFTHLALVQPTDEVASRLIAEAHETFKGSIAVAKDLDKFQ